MSAVLTPDKISPNNPIMDTSVPELLAARGLSIPADQVGEYTSFLKGIWEIWNDVDAMDDYVPSVDEERFPREHVHRPDSEDNPANAWAWRVTIKDKKPNKGLLAGKTVCLKDNVAVKGVPCLLGTDFIADWTPDTDATIVTRILVAGGTVLGKAVCENLSLWGSSDSAATGPISNVYAEGYSAGGSSSGTAVLVAHGDVDLGIGGDQGGSIRMPASKNGLVGMKPTFGLVPYTGVASFEATLDHVGPITRTVLDNALLLQAIAGADDIDDRQLAGCPFPAQVPDYPALAKESGGDLTGLRIGILRESLDCPVHDQRVSDLIVRAAESLAALGATVTTVSVPLHRRAPDFWAVIGRMSAAASWTAKSCGRRQLCLNDLTDKMVPVTQERFDKLFPSGVNTLVNGLWAWEHMPPTLLGKATNLVRKLRDAYVSVLDNEVDVIITPTLPILPQRLAPPDATPSAKMATAMGLTSNTSAFNLTGLPALTIPVGMLPPEDNKDVRFPVGMQLVGAMYNEVVLYRVGYAWSVAHDWNEF